MNLSSFRAGITIVTRSSGVDGGARRDLGEGRSFIRWTPLGGNVRRNRFDQDRLVVLHRFNCSVQALGAVWPTSEPFGKFWKSDLEAYVAVRHAHIHQRSYGTGQDDQVLPQRPVLHVIVVEDCSVPDGRIASKPVHLGPS